MRHLPIPIGRTVRAALLAVAAIAATVSGALAASPSPNANCVGQFSHFFAQGGGGTHRSDVAKGFAAELRPAGKNVYSHVAETHGTLEACFEQSAG
ncbi:MAG TPA: hypothetical protein VFO78_02465 [Candidatus Limnocylindrales bacterium]|nr:hypothetical protein [Candidatus Limnocylindrales bacterium]